MRETEKKYLKWYQKIAYGAGDLASNTSYGLVSSFVLLYLSDTMGLNTGIIGTLMLVSKFLDGISDVIFGNLIDRTKSKLGKARPWMLYAQIGVSLCLVLLFSIPGGLGTTAQYAYFFAFYTALNAISIQQMELHTQHYQHSLLEIRMSVFSLVPFVLCLLLQQIL